MYYEQVCEKCLYRKNCQFLAKHKTTEVSGCTAFWSEADFKSEVVREVCTEIEKEFELGMDAYLDEILCGHLMNFLAELKQKYTNVTDINIGDKMKGEN